MSCFVQVFLIKRLLTANSLIKATILQLIPIQYDTQSANVSTVLKSILEANLSNYCAQRFEESHIDSILLIYKTLMSQFCQEFEAVTRFEMTENKDDRKFECAHYNQKDLLTKTFQFLDFKSLNNCCLVNSIWLLSGFNSNSIYLINSDVMGKIMKLHMKSADQKKKTENTDNTDNTDTTDPTDTTGTTILTRIWQRLSNVRDINIYSNETSNSSNNQGLRKEFCQNIGKLKRLSHFRFGFYAYYPCAFYLIGTMIISDICENLIHFSFSTSIFTLQNYKALESGFRKLGRMNLCNCKYIYIKGYPLLIKISNKCEILHLIMGSSRNGKNKIQIGKTWINSIIKKSDMTGIKSLILSGIYFRSVPQELIEKFVQKLSNIKILTIRNVTQDMLLLMKCIKDILKTNNCQLNVDVRGSTFEIKCQLARLIADNNLPLNILAAQICGNHDNNIMPLLDECVKTKQISATNITQLIIKMPEIHKKAVQKLEQLFGIYDNINTSEKKENEQDEENQQVLLSPIDFNLFSSLSNLTIQSMPMFRSGILKQLFNF